MVNDESDDYHIVTVVHIVTIIGYVNYCDYVVIHLFKTKSKQLFRKHKNNF